MHREWWWQNICNLWSTIPSIFGCSFNGGSFFGCFESLFMGYCVSDSIFGNTCPSSIYNLIGSVLRSVLNEGEEFLPIILAHNINSSLTFIYSTYLQHPVCSGMWPLLPHWLQILCTNRHLSYLRYGLGGKSFQDYHRTNWKIKSAWGAKK